jgi:hypothetical protein
LRVVHKFSLQFPESLGDRESTPEEVSGVNAARKRSWERSMGQLAEGYERVLEPALAAAGRPLSQAA